MDPTTANNQPSNFLLEKIASLQVEQDDFYAPGLFPSQIVWRNGKKSVDDTNLFFTALIAYTLQSLKPTFSPTEQALVDQIVDRTHSAFPRYKNRKGGLTYNYYPVRPEAPFPGFKRFSKMEAARLPDDLDVTAMVWLSRPSNDQIDQQLKAQMVEQSFKTNRVKSTFPEYRASRAYRTWFAEKMRQDLDLCVNCNVLTFVFEKGLALDEVDQEAMDFIERVVQSEQHLTQGYYTASYYQRPTILLYHLARLIQVADDAQMNALRDRIIADLTAQLVSVENQMDKVIVLTSLYRLDAVVSFDLDLSQVEKAMDRFYWFYTNFLCGYPLWIKRLFGRDHFLNYRNRCAAYSWTLVLELQQLSGASILSHKENGMRLTQEAPIA